MSQGHIYWRISKILRIDDGASLSKLLAQADVLPHASRSARRPSASKEINVIFGCDLEACQSESGDPGETTSA